MTQEELLDLKRRAIAAGKASFPKAIADCIGQVFDLYVPGESALVAVRCRAHAGVFALVDLEDLELVVRHKWHLTYGGLSLNPDHLPYVKAEPPNGDSSRNKGVRLHRLLLGDKAGPRVDHKNGNPMDNRRCNIRPVTPGQNGANSRKRKVAGKDSKYKGVCRNNKGGKPWRATIMVDRHSRTIGSFATEEETALAYDRTAYLIYGEFAYLNFGVPKEFEGVPKDQLPEPKWSVKQPSNTGYVGVSRHVSGSFVAYYKGHYIGYFHSLKEAVAARRRAEIEVEGLDASGQAQLQGGAA